MADGDELHIRIVQTENFAKTTVAQQLAECYDRACWTIIFLLYSLSPFTVLWTPPLLALRTVRLLRYLLHALPSPLLYYIRVHQYLLMRTLRAPFMPVFPRRYRMYHCTFGARLPTP